MGSDFSYRASVGIYVCLGLSLACGRLNYERVDAGGPSEDVAETLDAADVASLPATWRPVNIDAALLSAGSGPLLIGTQGNAVLDTDSGILRRQSGNGELPIPGVVFTVVAQAAPAPELAVFSATQVSIEAGITLHVIGKRALVLAASGDIRIAGVVSVRGGNVQTNVHLLSSTGGPGGYSCCDAMDPSHRGPGAPVAANSNGGGGHLHGGGNGGTVGNALTLGGSIAGNPSLVPLIGGSAGGTDGVFAVGGGGGGALQLAALGILRIEASGGVHAGAAGGSFNGAVHGGGGAGGAILLDAAAVEVIGKLAANGGGGGANGSDAKGENGRFDAMPAKGGSTPPINGGAGGAGDVEPTDGATGSGGTGGGGSAGRIAIRSWSPNVDANALLSPSVASTGSRIEQVSQD